MKLFLSALLLTALPAAFAQEYQPVSSQSGAAIVTVVGPVDGQVPTEVLAKANAEATQQFRPVLQTGCPLYLGAASVSAPAGYLPVSQRRPDDGTLTLHFRNQSGKVIRSASVTATVKVKTNIYALDAHPVALQLTLSDVNDASRDLNQLRQIALPHHFYLFGLAQVSLDRVTFADGTSWTAPKRNYCGTNEQQIEQIEAK